jgi:hypothetical protein
MYALAAIALAEGLADRVLVLCPVADHRGGVAGEVHHAWRETANCPVS